MKKQTQNLTTGSPAKLILFFAIPVFIGILFQQLYNMADTFIVGRLLGTDALAAVGSVGSLNFMVMGFCIGVCSGFAIPVAQSFGAEDFVRLRKYIANSVWLSVIFACVMTVTVCIFCRPILEIMNTPDNIIDDAYSYIFIVFLGIPFTFLYNLLSGIVRALGDSKTPVYFLLLSSVVNVVLDVVTIYVFKMGVAGPAIATVFSQALSGILCLIYSVKKFELLHLKKPEWKLDKSCIMPLISSGLPMGLQYSITAIGSVVLQFSINSLGSDYVAAVTVSGKIGMFVCSPFEALGGTMATFAGQNIGARKTKRVKQGLFSAAAIGIVYAAAAAVVLCLFGKNIAVIFLEATETDILGYIQQVLTINSLSYSLLVLVNTFRFCIQGMGYSAFAVTAGVFEMVARTVMGLFVVPKFGFIAVCFTDPLAWLMADMFLIPAFIYCLNRKKRKFAKMEQNSTQSVEMFN